MHSVSSRQSRWILPSSRLLLCDAVLVRLVALELTSSAWHPAAFQTIWIMSLRTIWNSVETGALSSMQWSNLRLQKVSAARQPEAVGVDQQRPWRPQGANLDHARDQRYTLLLHSGELLHPVIQYCLSTLLTLACMSPSLC